MLKVLEYRIDRAVSGRGDLRIHSLLAPSLVHILFNQRVFGKSLIHRSSSGLAVLWAKETNPEMQNAPQNPGPYMQNFLPGPTGRDIILFLFQVPLQDP